MKRSSFLSQSVKKSILNNDNIQNYNPQYTCYYFIDKEKKKRIRIINQKYATFLHRLLDENIPSLKNNQYKTIKSSKNYSRNKQNNIFISRTKNSTDFSIYSKNESQITNLKLKISPKKSPSKQKNIIPPISSESTKKPEGKKFDYISKNKYLQKLYEFDKIFSKIKSLIKRRKNLDLKNYQENIVKISGDHLSRKNMMKFISELNKIRKNAEMVQPLPPINFPALIINSLKENENKEKKEIQNKIYTEFYGCEKGKHKIKQTTKKNKIIFRRNENNGFFKSYNCLPGYLVNSITKSKIKL